MIYSPSFRIHPARVQTAEAMTMAYALRALVASGAQYSRSFASLASTVFL